MEAVIIAIIAMVIGIIMGIVVLLIKKKSRLSTEAQSRADVWAQEIQDLVRKDLYVVENLPNDAEQYPGKNEIADTQEFCKMFDSNIFKNISIRDFEELL